MFCCQMCDDRGKFDLSRTIAVCLHGIRRSFSIRAVKTISIHERFVAADHGISRYAAVQIQYCAALTFAASFFLVMNESA